MSQIVDETFQNGMINRDYSREYLFYFHIISQCQIVLNTPEVDTAGISFKDLKYQLHINEKWFGDLDIPQRLAVLKHEAFHIIYSHIGRSSELDHKRFNIASDCAINQQINRDHLPDKPVLPDSMAKELGIDVPENKDSEFYYELLQDKMGEDEDQPQNGSGSCDGGDGDGEPQDGDGKDGMGSHSLWEDSDNDEASKELQKTKSKQLFDNAVERSKGNLPQEISTLIEFFETKKVVDWRKVLRRITSNKVALKEPTIKKQSRRIRQLGFKGNKKSHKFDIVVLLDVSGSMSDDDIVYGLNEIRNISKNVSADICIIQIDTKVYTVEDFKPNQLQRNGCGGTEMGPGYDYIHKNKIPCDCSVLITDGCVEDSARWKLPKCKNIVLTVAQEVRDPRIQNFKLRENQ